MNKGPNQSTAAIELIKAERLRQIHDLGHSDYTDSQYRDSELALAAICYAEAVAEPDASAKTMDKSRSSYAWPWDEEYWRPSADPIRNLIKAGALIAAEIDRRLRRRLQKKEAA